MDAYDEELAAITVGEPTVLAGRVELREYDPAWPQLFEREAARIRAALGDRALRVEHVGSTSVPGLAAKPVIDVVLEVADPADEPAYVPPFEAAGLVLRSREPAWFEHRMLKGADPEANVHVFGRGCEEAARMLAFRDRLRASAPDRELYERTKRELAARDWRYLQQYADAKSAVVREIPGRP
jgi:GrpB-like predicted nucleotidyltransferase (UPF0157 family)